MDRETHPNAVYRYDPNSQIIYPVDGKTDQPLSEISRYLIKKQKKNIVENGMIKNVRKAIVVGIKGDFGQNTTPTYNYTQPLSSQQATIYLADFVVNVFIMPDEYQTLDDVRKNLDNYFEVVDNKGSLFASSFKRYVYKETNGILENFGETNIENLPLEAKKAIKNIPFTRNALFLKNYFDRKNFCNTMGYSYQYVEKIVHDPDNPINNVWELNPEFGSFKLPFTIFQNGKKEYHLVHLHMKFVVKLVDSTIAEEMISNNQNMENHFIYLISKTNNIGKNLFCAKPDFGSNISIITTHLLETARENAIFHEVGHSLFMFADAHGDDLDYGNHNIVDDDIVNRPDFISYMAGGSPTLVTAAANQFTNNDLLALAFPKVKSETYGLALNRISKDNTKKDMVAQSMEYEERQYTYQSQYRYLRTQQHKKIFSNDLYIFSMSISKEKPIQSINSETNKVSNKDFFTLNAFFV